MNFDGGLAGDSFLSDFEQENVRNFCSWLLNFNAYELPLLSYGIAVILSEAFTIQERTIIGSIFSTIATNTFLIASQQGFLRQVENSKNNFDGRKKDGDFASLVGRVKNIENILKKFGVM